MNIGIVIPIYNLCEYRQRSLAFNLHHLSNSKMYRNVVVVEQHSSSTMSYDIIQRFPSIEHKIFEIDSDVFNKSVLLNKYIHDCTFDYIWMLDVDVYLDVDYVTSQIPSNSHLIRPYEFIQNLNETESDHLLKTTYIKFDEVRREVNNAFGKYSFIINTDLIKSIGGYDEEYEGWGFQDLDLMSRLPKDIVHGYTKNIAFHLYHPTASRKKYNKNKELFNKKGNFKKLVPRKKKILDKNKNI